MPTLNVALGERSYPILIGPGLVGCAESYVPWLKGRQVLLVTNETVACLYLPALKAALSDYDVVEVILPDGERFKDLEHVNRIFDVALGNRLSRGCTFIALGGGVVGDMTGFAAACYQRGVRFLQVPTTLLAQVDSSVGGKTGVNHPLGKNMIGAFKQPVAVVADTEVLATLPERELSAGLAEVIKYGLIRDLPFFEWLEANMERLRARNADALTYAIERSCQNKADVVAADELETADIRALLNLGHTFGHAIEAGLGYGEWLHGEAVGCGMLMAADLSWRLGWLSPDDVQRVRALLVRAGCPVVPPVQLTPERYLELMAVDKKVQDGRIRFVLLRALGHAVVEDAAPREVLLQTLCAGERLGALA